MADRKDAAGELAGPGLPEATDRPHRARGVSPVPLLLILSAVFLGSALFSGFFGILDRSLGFQRLVAAALAFLFLYAAWMTREQGRVRERLLDLMEEVLKIFYGPNFRREREAIDILLKGLDSDSPQVRRSSLEHLNRLTRQDFGDDGAAWRAWWVEHRSTFRSPQSGAKNS
ncbi:MAG: hypothetical protein V2A76_02615 [Planctomycetota bacterium]